MNDDEMDALDLETENDDPETKFASLAMSLSSVSVIINSLRLNKAKI